MNKRIRKKQLKRVLCELAVVCDKYEAARERILNEAVQGLLDARGQSREIECAALRHCIEAASFLALSGPPSRFLLE